MDFLGCFRVSNWDERSLSLWVNFKSSGFSLKMFLWTNLVVNFLLLTKHFLLFQINTFLAFGTSRWNILQQIAFIFIFYTSNCFDEKLFGERQNHHLIILTNKGGRKVFVLGKCFDKGEERCSMKPGGLQHLLKVFNK